MHDAIDPPEHATSNATTSTHSPSPTATTTTTTTHQTRRTSSSKSNSGSSPNSLISPELAAAVRVCIRSYGVGYVFATAPKLIKTVIGFLLNPRKVTPRGQNPVAAFFRAILSVAKDGTSARRDGMSMLLMITLGGYKLLEVFLNRGMKKAILAQHLQQRQQQQQQQHQKQGDQQRSLQKHQGGDHSDAGTVWTKDDMDKIELTSDIGQRITMMASFLSSAAAIVFMHRYRSRHATIDYSLFAVVRALDVFGHVAVKNRWGPSWLGSYGAVAVFVLACTEIMFSWLYEPERLPGPYAFWITRMSRMDKRLLETLRAVREDRVHFGQSNPPEVSNLLIGLCEDLGFDPKMGDFELRNRLSCRVVHQGIADSCEVHTGYRWIQGFMVSAGIYLPVHLLPALLSPKAFFEKLQKNPISTASSTLLAAARSSAFLATYIALIWYGICSWRSKIMPLVMKLTGRRYSSNVIDNIYGPLLGSFMCGFSVLIEKPHRRAEMALYVLPRAMYSMWSRVMSGRLSRRVERTGETLMYAISMSVLLTGMMWKREMVRPSMQGLLGWMLEVPKAKRHARHGHHHHGKGKGKALAEHEDIESSTAVVEDKDALAAVENARGH
ncbi:hypothetical protein BC939DRAFT_433955 [Gamsiella multidivaricata]|uniref:uncharacterized protein n=1 Tax=Gamsiella multidivaricata TaxID=101098 RepID=UPI00221E791B|nr:uncharacterized protein BC939DRAFT_433955 [Gamsiella multidivaricata]KAG0364846.1 hypothetical protein BGZ54_007098 [Gamsiella multidivaricata]KAI7832642.1 hypothetical protein BC939DRAFT_433955 [Gamsiella multidivaricata]